MSDTPLLTNEVARICGVSPATVRLWERNGRLPALRTAGGVRLFARKDAERIAGERLNQDVSGDQPEDTT
jgi:DNA-binding transcriptional MerR regulator